MVTNTSMDGFDRIIIKIETPWLNSWLLKLCEYIYSGLRPLLNLFIINYQVLFYFLLYKPDKSICCKPLKERPQRDSLLERLVESIYCKTVSVNFGEKCTRLSGLLNPSIVGHAAFFV